jgi:hypothetical protein
MKAIKSGIPLHFVSFREHCGASTVVPPVLLTLIEVTMSQRRRGSQRRLYQSFSDLFMTPDSYVTASVV